jgi:hypothetical protein
MPTRLNKADLKYPNYIIMKWPHKYKRAEGHPVSNFILGLNDSVVKGAFTVNCSWVAPGPNPDTLAAHVHPFDEVIAFIGTNPQDPGELGAEAELWIDDEKYIINKTFLAFFPGGLVHCPLTVRDVKQPIFRFTVSLTGQYTQQWARDIITRK